METTNNKLINFYLNIKNNSVIRKISSLFSSVWGIAIMAFLTFFFYALSLEIVFYYIVGIYVVFVCLFCDDLLPLVCLFLFCYVSPSTKNNPGISETSIFYGSSLIGMIIVVAVALISIFLRIGFDKNMGYKKLFTKKRALLWGMLALGVAYMLSGIGSKHYSEIYLKNLLFAFLQFASIFLLYFVFSATIDWKKVPKNYFAYLGMAFGLIVVAEIFFAFLFKSAINEGVIFTGPLRTGWGMKNNVGAVTGFTIPFAFYLACKEKHTYIYFSIATILMIATAMTCSRAATLSAGLIFIICFIFVFFKAKNKKWYRISCGIFVLLSLILGVLFWDKIQKLFSLVPSIINTSGDGGSMFNDSYRLSLYKFGLKEFLKFPILGQSFYPVGINLYEFSTVTAFTSFFPARWHNTIVQLLFSTGIVGMIAYSFHRLQTIKLLFKKRTLEKLFIAASISALLIMSLLDCHFFNLGPTMFYSVFLMFAEFTESDEDEKQEEITNPNDTENKTEIEESTNTEKEEKTLTKPKTKNTKSKQKKAT